MLSAGMFSDLAARMAPRRRGLVSGSPPPFFAAMVISLISRVKILPRFASSAPFLCLIVAHLEWPDMNGPSLLILVVCTRQFSMLGQRFAFATAVAKRENNSQQRRCEQHSPERNYDAKNDRPKDRSPHRNLRGP